MNSVKYFLPNPNIEIAGIHAPFQYLFEWIISFGRLWEAKRVPAPGGCGKPSDQILSGLPYLWPDQIWKIGFVLFTAAPGCGYFSMTCVWN